jgi:hypothetical protein
MSPILGIWASQISGHLWAPEGAYDSLATVTVPSGGSSTIDFVGIPDGYKHLQIRGISQISYGGGTQYGYLSLRLGNGSIDTGSNYSNHLLRGQGTDVASSGAANATYSWAGMTWLQTGSSSYFGVGVIDILDYANTNKYKTVRALGGADANASTPPGVVAFLSGNWRSTSAVNQIRLLSIDGNFKEFSQFALYGIK